LNYADVLQSLENGHLGGLGLDVFHAEPIPTTDNPFLSHPKVLLTPHVAGVTEHSYRNMARELAKVVDDLIVRNIVPEHTVNIEMIKEG
jgi:phosphoglycerate dehydrogenase-like enzyme